MKMADADLLRRYTRSTPPRDGVPQGRRASMRDVNSSDGARLGEARWRGALSRTPATSAYGGRGWCSSGAAVLAPYWGPAQAVDGGLLGDWVEWSQPTPAAIGSANVSGASDVFRAPPPLKAPASPANATAVWCALAPRGCGSCSRHPSSGGVSALRASLVKVLGRVVILQVHLSGSGSASQHRGGDVPPRSESFGDAANRR